MININQKGITHLILLFLILAGIAIGVCLISKTQIFKPYAAETQSGSLYIAKPGEHRLGIRMDSKGKSEFYDKTTNQEFLFRGVNYIKLSDQGHSVFDPQSYNPEEVQTALDKLQANGYNSVRVFINENTVGDPAGGLSSQYMQNVTDYLKKAKAANIYVVITFTYAPRTSPSYGFDLAQFYSYGFTGMYLAPNLVEGKKRFVKDFVSALKTNGAPMEDTVYSLDNEVAFTFNIFDPRTNNIFTYKPFDLPSYTAPNGKTYSLTDPTDKKKMMDESLIYAADLWKNAIKEIDPDALVGIGFYSPKVPEAAPDKAYVNAYPALANPEEGGSSLDFIDLHIYPNRYSDWSVDSDLEAFQIAKSNTKKPLIIGEFGAEQVLIPFNKFNKAAEKILDIEVQTCKAGFKGWIFWQYDLNTDYNLLQNNEALNNILAPVKRPDPCKS